MSSSELSSGEGTTAARREAAQGRNGAALRAATRSRAAEGQPAASMCALLRRGRSSAKQQRVLLRVPAAQGPLMRPLVARHAVGHNKKDAIAPQGDVDRAYLSHTAPVRVGNVPCPVALRPWCATPCPLASSPCLSAQPLSSMGRILHGSDARACLHRTRWGLQPRAAWRRSLAHALVRQHSHT